MTNCAPPSTPAGLPIVDIDDPCAMLQYLTNAYLELSTGKQVVEIRHPGGFGFVRYARADLRTLQEQIGRYQSLCNSGRGGRTIRVGPYVPRHRHLGYW